MSNEFETDRRDTPYNNLPPVNNIATWLQFVMVIGAMTVSWTSLNTNITKIDVKQMHIKEDLEKLDVSFEKHNVVHLKSINDVKAQVNDLERSVTLIYRNTPRRK